MLVSRCRRKLARMRRIVIKGEKSVKKENEKKEKRGHYQPNSQNEHPTNSAPPGRPVIAIFLRVASLHSGAFLRVAPFSFPSLERARRDVEQGREQGDDVTTRTGSKTSCAEKLGANDGPRRIYAGTMLDSH